MEELHAACDKLFTEVDHLDHVVGEELRPEHVALALSIAKRVRRDSTLLVRLLAAARDQQLQPEEAQAT